MKKVVLITPILQHYRLSFYEKISKGLKEIELHVLYGYKEKDDGRPSYKGHTNFISKGFREKKIRVLAFDLVYNRGLFREVRKLNPDLIIVQGIAGDLSNRLILSWARRKQKKIILWACGWEPGRAKGFMLRLKNYFVSTFFRKADFCLTYSTHASNYAERMGIDPSIIRTCYNGIETDELEKKKEYIVKKSIEIREKLSLDGFITFLYVGGLISEKKPDFLIDAFQILRKRYSNLMLIIIGDGPLRKPIESKIELLGDKNILYLGRIIEDVDAYFAAADCFVMPGIGGLALNQSMFWKVPGIVSEADGTEDDLVQEGYNGYRFENNNLDSLVSAMERRILENPENVIAYGLISHDIIASKSNVNNMVSHFVEAITKLLIDND